MSEPAPDDAREPARDDARADRLRWIARGVAAAIGLWFLVDGLRGVWSEADAVTQVLLVGAVLLGLGLLVLVLLRLTRRGRGD